MKKLVWILPLTGLLVWMLRVPEQLPAQRILQEVSADAGSFLIQFGLRDETGRDWSGSIEGEAGTIQGLEGWQFGSADSVATSGWAAHTVVEEYWDTPWERSLEGTKRRKKLTRKGVVASLRLTSSPVVRVETRQGGFSFRPSEIVHGSPSLFLDGAVEVSRIPSYRRLTRRPAVVDYPAGLQTRAGQVWLAYQSFQSKGDYLVVQSLAGQPREIASPRQSYAGIELAEDGKGRLWAVWSMQGRGNWDLYGRFYDGQRWHAVERLTQARGADIFHRLVSDAEGRLFLVWQSARDGNFDIYLRVYDGEAWGPELRVSDDPANDWAPDIAAGPAGRAAIVWDTYSRGNYDVMLRRYENGRLLPVEPVTTSPAFESRARAVYDPRGRLWLAWDEGDAAWGKDYVNGVKDAGAGLLMRRQIRVARWENGSLVELPAEPEEALPEEFRRVFHDGRLAFDGNGNPWLFFHYRTNTPVVQAASGRYRTMWRMGATVFRDGRWSPMIEFVNAYGRIDFPISVARDPEGNLNVWWSSDGRTYPTGFPQGSELLTATLPAAPKPAREPAWRPYRPPRGTEVNLHPREAADVARVRAYRAEAGGKSYRVVRGDMHRHTDISWDGNRDGSLIDAYRYALDAAAHDFIGVADHGAGEYIAHQWWLGQKAVDMFTIQGRFAPLYGYERSRSYPSGHRNAMYADRGVEAFPISEAERRNQEGVAKFYSHLRWAKGIAMSHTSATGAGNDWSDIDPVLEPLVEIYQGYRENYEHEGAPRAPEKATHPLGLVWKAWEKGLKLGVQASSDHVSTHASYSMIWVEDVNRQAILYAIRARRSYAATDNIIVDFRVNGRMMGEAFESPERPSVSAKVIGTAPIAKVELIRNNRYIHTQPASGEQIEFTYIDQAAEPGESYYYIRVEQTDGQLAWASPVWVTYKPQ